MSAHELHEIRAIADLAFTANSDQLLVPQSHFVDVLLDLRSVAVSPVVRSMIDDRLREVRFVSMIEASEVHADIEGLVAVSEIEDELEMAWADVAMTCECDECGAAIVAHEARSLASS
jgi:hypothetical protein